MFASPDRKTPGRARPLVRSSFALGFLIVVVGLALEWLAWAALTLDQEKSRGRLVLDLDIETPWLMTLVSDWPWLLAAAHVVGIILLGGLAVMASRSATRRTALVPAFVCPGVVLQTLLYPFLLHRLPESWQAVLPQMVLLAWSAGLCAVLLWFSLPRDRAQQRAYRRFVFSREHVPGVLLPGLLAVCAGAAVAYLCTHVPYESLSRRDHAIGAVMGGCLSAAFYCQLLLSILAISAAGRLLVRFWPRKAWQVGFGMVAMMAAVMSVVLLTGFSGVLRTQLFYIHLASGLRYLQVLFTVVMVFTVLRLFPRLSPAFHRSHFGAFWFTLTVPFALPFYLFKARGAMARAGRAIKPVHVLMACLACLVLIAPLRIDPVEDWMSYFKVTQHFLLFLLCVCFVMMVSMVMIPRRPRRILSSRASAISLLIPATLVFLAASAAFVSMQANHQNVKAALLEQSPLALAQYYYYGKTARVLRLDRIRPSMAGHTIPGPESIEAPTPFALVPKAPNETPMNLIVVLVDALRHDALHCTGNPRPVSPVLDEMLVRDHFFIFDNAYTQFNITNASMPTLLAGQPIPRLGQESDNAQRDAHLNLLYQLLCARDDTLLLLSAGYGVQSLFPEHPRKVLILPDPAGRGTAGESLRACQRSIEALAGKGPFLAYIHLMDTHNKLWKKADAPDFGDSLRDLYDNNVSYVDKHLGAFLQFLRDGGYDDNTAILITADHGEQFFEHGNVIHGYSAYEEELRVPLLIRLPGRTGGRVGGVVTLTDALPMLLGEAGWQIVNRRQAVPTLAELGSQTEDHALRTFYSCFKSYNAIKMDGRFKLIYRPDLDSWRFYDLKTDPMERVNLIDADRRHAMGILAFCQRTLARNPRPAPK